MNPAVVMAILGFSAIAAGMVGFGGFWMLLGAAMIIGTAIYSLAYMKGK